MYLFESETLACEFGVYISLFMAYICPVSGTVGTNIYAFWIEYSNSENTLWHIRSAMSFFVSLWFLLDVDSSLLF